MLGMSAAVIRTLFTRTPRPATSCAAARDRELVPLLDLDRVRVRPLSTELVQQRLDFRRGEPRVVERDATPARRELERDGAADIRDVGDRNDRRARRHVPTVSRRAAAFGEGVS